MSFRISKASFSLHIVRLYLRFCSLFIFLLFEIIELSKWIIFLQLFFSGVSYYSVLFTRASTDLFSLIQWKADAKLLKKRLLYVFWWYFITGVARWNYTFLFILAIPVGPPNIWNIFVSSPLNVVWYSFYINLVHTSWNNLDLVDQYTMHCCVKIFENNWIQGSKPQNDDHFRKLIQM